MAAIAWSDVVSLAPALSSTVTLTQDDILAYVNGVLNVALYDGEDGPRTRLARIYLAAHYASVARLGAGGSLIGSEGGGLSRQYAPVMSSSKLALTAYGQAFLAMLPPAARGPMVC